MTDCSFSTARLIVLLFFFMPFYAICQASDPVTDSLQRIWNQDENSVHDSTRLKAGKKLLSIYSKSNHESMLKICQTMIDYGTRKSNNAWLSRGWNSKGLYHFYKGHSDSAALCYRTALTYCPTEGDPARMDTYSNLGLLCATLNQMDSAIYFLNYAADLVHRYGHNKINLAKLYGNLSVCYITKGSYVKALQYEQEAMKYGDDKQNATSAFNIGTIFNKVGLEEEAKVNFEKSLALAQKSNWPADILKGYLAMLKTSPSEDSMTFYLKTGIRLADSLDMKIYKVNLMVTAAINYMYAGNLKEAEHWIDQSVEMLKHFTIKSAEVEILIQKAKLKNLQRKHRESYLLCKKIQPELEKNNTIDLLYLLYDLLSKNFQALGRNDSALYYLQQKEKVTDQIYDSNFSREILKSYLNYKAEQDQKQLENELETSRQIALVNAQKAKISYWLFGIVTLFLLSIALFYFYIYTQKKKSAAQLTLVNDALEDEKERLKKINTKLLRYNQVVSHDILSNLDLVLSTGNVLVGANKNSKQSLFDYYHISQRTIRHLKKYSIELLNDSENKERPTSSFDPMPAMNEVLEQFHLVLQKKGATIKVEQLPPSPLPAAHVTQVFHSLVSNFIRYASDVPNPTLSIGPRQNNDYQVQWVISDNGSGISQATWQQIMESGQTSSNHGQGKGLGLLLQMLRSYEAQMDMEVPAGGGTRFVISFPKGK